MLTRERVAEIRELRGRYDGIIDEGRRYHCPEVTARDIAAGQIGLDALLAVEDLLAERHELIEEVMASREMIRDFEVWTGFDSTEVPHG